MLFVKKDTKGNIEAISRKAEAGFEPCTPETRREVQKFIDDQGDQAAPKDALLASDNELARVTEDLIHLLINKQLIMFTELPEPVQKKILAREKLRAKLGDSGGTLMDDEGSI